MEERLFYARIDDTVQISERTNKCKYMGFLSLEQSAAAKAYLDKCNVRYGFFGGYDDAQRVMLGCFPEWASGEDYPISAVTFSYRKADNLTHRDFLGSLMGLGLTREAVGDILVEEGRAVAFLSDEIADYVISQLSKIGRTGVTVKKGYEGKLPQSGTLADFSSTVASLRLDCVVSALAGFSRSDANEKIGQGFVSVNSFITEKNTLTVNEGDVIAVRGKGKFIIGALDGRTRKDRVVLNYKKYV